jgi:hypothetical protein
MRAANKNMRLASRNFQANFIGRGDFHDSQIWPDSRAHPPKCSDLTDLADLQRRQNANAFASSFGQTSFRTVRHPGMPHGVTTTLSEKPRSTLGLVVIAARESLDIGQPWLFHISSGDDSA